MPTRAGEPLKTFVVVPCFNEAARLNVAAFETFLAATDVALVFVDDGSSDGTHDVLVGICRSAPQRSKLVPLPRNGGKAEAIRAGVNAALDEGAECVGYWDADLATPLSEIETCRRMLESDPGLVGVLGSRVRRLGAKIDRNSLRHYFGRVFATFASLVLDLPVYDTQCGAKLFRVDEDVRAAFATPFTSRWIFDVELLARIAGARRRAGLSAEAAFAEHPLPVWTDVGGSKLRLRDGLLAFRDLYRIWVRYRPARAVTVGSPQIAGRIDPREQ